MKQHLNTLFISTEGAWVCKEGQALAIRVEKETRLRVPAHNLGGIVCLGRVGVTPPAMQLCAEKGVAISFCNPYGRFLARVSGFTPGNVLLRREQYRRADDSAATADIVRGILLGKIANCRSVIQRVLRDRPASAAAGRLAGAVQRLGIILDQAGREGDPERLRGLEGEAANHYFSVFDHFITRDDDAFRFTGRSRRPPMDRVNALLSFLYTMLAHDARSACEAAGLDPAVGFLHRDRPGRPSLALDLMEEFRAVLADRVALSLINRGQVNADGFQIADTGAVLMSDATRREVLATYQKRKQETIMHPFIQERTTVGLLVHLQARLLARYLRGDLDGYPPFIWK